MSIKPILFNTEMVRAILDGRKTCTRRLVKPQPGKEYKNVFTISDGETLEWVFAEDLPSGSGVCVNPPYQPGDILYVRETWKRAANGYYYYESWQKDDIADIIKWKPSIHMPRKAARIWLEVTNVRVERLQEITEDECIAEGIYKSSCRGCNATFGCDVCPNEGYEEIEEFIELWNSTIKKNCLDRYGWDANPWVWVVEFKRCDKPKELLN